MRSERDLLLRRRLQHTLRAAADACCRHYAFDYSRATPDTCFSPPPLVFDTHTPLRRYDVFAMLDAAAILCFAMMPSRFCAMLRRRALR